MQIEITPFQAQFAINCIQVALNKQVEDGNGLMGLLNTVLTPPVVEPAPVDETQDATLVPEVQTEG